MSADARDLYLDLLKKSLTDFLHIENDYANAKPLACGARSPWTHKLRWRLLGPWLRRKNWLLMKAVRRKNAAGGARAVTTGRRWRRR